MGIFAVAVLFVGGLRPALARDEIAFPDVDGYQTLKCDLHMHTVFSDGNVWPTVRVQEAWREGLDAIAITDHIEYQPHREDIPTRHDRPYEVASDLARRYGIILVRGCEITRDTPPGHYNVIFTENNTAFEVDDFYAVFAEAARQRAFVFWNHPEWKGLERGKWGEWQQTLLDRKQLHGIEIGNGDQLHEQGFGYAMEHDLVLIGNSDIHDPSMLHETTPAEHRTLTLVLARDKSIDGLREAVFAGRTLVWCGDRLIGRREWLKPMFEACVEVRPAHHLGGDGSAWTQLVNRCDVDVRMKSGEDSPAEIVLPAGSTVLVRFRVTPDTREHGWKYEVSNWLVGPGKPLEVALRVPGIEQPQAAARSR